MKKIGLILLILGALILCYLIMGIGFTRLLQSIYSAKKGFVALASLCYIAAVVLRGIKWKLLFDGEITKNNSVKKFLGVYSIVHCIGALTPLRSGELVGPILFKKYLNYPLGTGAAVITIDFFLECIVFLVGVIFALCYLQIIGFDKLNYTVLIPFKFGVVLLLIMGITILSTVVLLKHYSLKRKGNRTNRLSKVIPDANTRDGRLREQFRTEADVFWKAIKTQDTKTLICVLFPLTFMAWVFDILRVFILFTAIVDYQFIDVVVSFMLVALLSIFFLVPLDIGIGELGWLFVLGQFGYKDSTILSGILLDRIISTATFGIIGVIGIIYVKKIRN